jgi:CopG family nickel-responsive transcriptional regulator
MERFTISLDDGLARDFDRWIAEHGYGNRSEAVRDLLRAHLAQVQESREADGPCVANLSYVYNHHERELSERLAHLQHDHHELHMATTHVHLDHDQCIETVMLRGPASAVRRFADTLMAERGVHHGQLNVVMVRGGQAGQGHGHGHGHDHGHGSNPALPPR